MANRNDGGQDYDDRNRNTGGREGSAGVGRGYAEENRLGNRWYGREHEGNRENWGGDRGYGQDVDWRSDWRQGQGNQGQDWGRGREGSGSGSSSSGSYGSGSGQSGQGSYGQGGYNQGGYGQGQSNYGQGGYGNYNRGEGWNQGPHSGRGPQGYQRSNERIQEEVCEALTRHGHVDASGINVRVEQGEVILEGTVTSRREKRLAEEAVESLSGVKDVHNHLRVRQGDQGNGGSLQETSPAHQAGLQSGSTGGASGSTGADTGSSSHKKP